MTKWVIDWETMNCLLQRFKESENEWKKQHPYVRRIIPVDSIEYFIYCAFEKYGFLVEENNNG